MPTILGPAPINDKSSEGQYWNALRNFDDMLPQEMVKRARAVGKSLTEIQADLRMIRQTVKR